MIKSLYHASPVRFSKLKKTNEEGIHLGSEVSALQAAVRHDNRDLIYLYKVTVDLGEKIEEYEDIGHGWVEVIEDCISNGETTSVMYRNNNEESIYPSYLLLREEQVIITECKKIFDFYEALEEIDILLAEEGLIDYSYCMTAEEHRLECEF